MKNLLMLAITGLLFLLGSCTPGQWSSAEKCYQKGTELLKGNNVRSAYKFFKQAAKKDPDNFRYQWSAAISSPDQNAAFVHTEAAWKDGLKNPIVLFKLVSLSFYTKESAKLEYALDLFKQLPDSLRQRDLKGDIFYQFQNSDSALSIWMDLLKENPNPSLCNKIALAYSKRGDINKAESFLEEYRIKKILNGTGYIILASIVSFKYEYSKVDSLFTEAKRFGYSNDSIQLEYMGFLIAQERYLEAEPVLRDLAEPAPGQKESLLNHRARLNLAYVYASAGKEQDLKTMISHSSGNTAAERVEKGFFVAVQKIMNDSANSLEAIRQARKEAPQDPIIDLLCARENARKANFKEAISFYKILPGIMLRSPKILTEYAYACTQIGNDDEALKVISSMHNHSIFTKLSLELFRELTFKNNLIEKSFAAQDLLEKQFPKDISVKLGEASMALRTGNIDKGLLIYEELIKNTPKNPPLEMARISCYFLKKDYKKVLSACEASQVPAYFLAPLEARAHFYLGNKEDAQKAFEKGLEAKRTPSLLLEYADYLVMNGKNNEASKIYEEIISTKNELLEKDNVANAIVLNNLVWSQLDQATSDKKVLLNTIKKAYELSPHNPNILDTYASVLLKTNDYPGCIKLLEADTITAREPRLLIYLANSYEKNKNINKAVRTLEDAFMLADSSGRMPIPIDKSAIKLRIETLKK